MDPEYDSDPNAQSDRPFEGSTDGKTGANGGT